MAVSMLWNAHPMTILVRTDDVLLQAYAPVPIVFATFIGNRVLFKIIAATHNTKLSLNAFFRFRRDYVHNTTDSARTVQCRTGTALYFNTIDARHIFQNCHRWIHASGAHIDTVYQI